MPAKAKYASRKGVQGKLKVLLVLMSNILSPEKNGKAFPWIPTKPRFHQRSLQQICYMRSVILSLNSSMGCHKRDLLGIGIILQQITDGDMYKCNRIPSREKIHTSRGRMQHHTSFRSRLNAQDPVKPRNILPLSPSCMEPKPSPLHSLCLWEHYLQWVT